MGRPSPELVDFRYRIFSTDGGEVGRCGNEAYCFVRFVTSKGLTDKEEILVETTDGAAASRSLESGLVTVNMGQPQFMPSEVPSVPDLKEGSDALIHTILVGLGSVPVDCVNMSNPHAMIIVRDTGIIPVGQWGEAIGSYEQFPRRVNIGFMQVINR